MQATTPSSPPSQDFSATKQNLPARSQMGCILPLRAPHVLWLPVVRVSDRFGSQRLCAACPLVPRHRQPENRVKTQNNAFIRGTYSPNSDGDGLWFEVFIQSDEEPWVHRWNKEVKHPMVLFQHDYAEVGVSLSSNTTTENLQAFASVNAVSVASKPATAGLFRIARSR